MRLGDLVSRKPTRMSFSSWGFVGGFDRSVRGCLRVLLVSPSMVHWVELDERVRPSTADKIIAYDRKTWGMTAAQTREQFRLARERFIESGCLGLDVVDRWLS